MWTPAQKYYGEQDERYGGKLQWPGASGVPFLGDAAPSLKQHEIEALPVLGQAKEYVFDLNDEDDREYYNWVRDRICNGMFTRNYIERHREDGHKWPVVYMEWTQHYVTAPPQTSPGSTKHGSTTHFTLRRPRKS